MRTPAGKRATGFGRLRFNNRMIMGNFSRFGSS
jgi:hypothetical protein